MLLLNSASEFSDPKPYKSPQKLKNKNKGRKLYGGHFSKTLWHRNVSGTDSGKAEDCDCPVPSEAHGKAVGEHGDYYCMS